MARTSWMTEDQAIKVGRQARFGSPQVAAYIWGRRTLRSVRVKEGGEFVELPDWDPEWGWGQ